VHAFRDSCRDPQGTSSYRTMELPSIPETKDGQLTSTNGFTSLMLPRAAVSADEARGLDLFSGHVDRPNSRDLMGNNSGATQEDKLNRPGKQRWSRWDTKETR
ncbi:hypothetical protein FS837_001156, partial [Tulasnella sp. UAMH 9824]